LIDLVLIDLVLIDLVLIDPAFIYIALKQIAFRIAFRMDWSVIVFSLLSWGSCYVAFFATRVSANSFDHLPWGDRGLPADRPGL
jgi:hypothetical protein